jgi:hypothetical protein
VPLTGGEADQRVYELLNALDQAQRNRGIRDALTTILLLAGGVVVGAAAAVAKLRKRRDQQNVEPGPRMRPKALRAGPGGS